MLNQIRVLQVFGGLNRGGSESMIMNLYRKIDRSTIQFDFVKHTNRECPYEQEIRTLGGQVYCAPKFKVYNYFSYRKWWKKFFLQHPEYKIVHGHLFTIASIFFNVAHEFGCITIGHSHSAKSPIKSLKSLFRLPFIYSLSKESDYRFACSQKAGKWIYKDKPFFVIINAIDIEKFTFSVEKRKKIRDEFDLQKKIILGNIGRLTIQKNQSFLIDIFAAFHKKNSNSALMIVGTGELEKSLKEKVSKLGLNDSVLFTGSRPDVPDLLSAMDVFVFPSLWEGLPVTVIEAQAAGIPCLISDSITSEVVISDLVSCLPINQGVEPWLTALDACRIERVDVSKKVLESGFDIKSNTKKITDFYMKLSLKK